MAHTTTTRQTAEERRVAVLAAANVEFALRGLHGASTDTIARNAGISQPYLFRLFGSKKGLFIAVIEEDHTMLQGQLQSYAASVEDADIRAATARGYGRLVDFVETVSGADRVTIARFFAKGMLMNVLAAMQYSITNDANEPWVVRLAEGCREDDA